jgi:hypothetical protein
LHFESHDPAYWLDKAAKALKRAERCHEDAAARALLLELADDYAWLAKRVRPLSKALPPQAAPLARSLEIAR